VMLIYLIKAGVHPWVLQFLPPLCLTNKREGLAVLLKGKRGRTIPEIYYTVKPLSPVLTFDTKCY
jgi:hypothetical protein